jgi:hypothetical protein
VSEKRAVYFRVEWDDGTIWEASGETAEAVMRWYGGCEAMNCIHGASYKGPQITITEPSR